MRVATLTTKPTLIDEVGRMRRYVTSSAQDGGAMRAMDCAGDGFDILLRSLVVEIFGSPFCRLQLAHVTLDEVGLRVSHQALGLVQVPSQTS